MTQMTERIKVNHQQLKGFGFGDGWHGVAAL